MVYLYNSIVTGPRGPVGTQGIQGSPGITGVIGPQGSPGVTGPPGATGAQGTQGIQGSPGITGVVGPQGSPGVTGPAGQGTPGATGPQGIQGSPGINGSQGSPGVTGAQGIQGSPGVTGPQGAGGATNAVTYGGAINTGITGPVFNYIPGITQAGMTGGSIDVIARQTANRGTVKSTSYTTQFELLTTNTGWSNAHVFSIDNSTAGATATVTKFSATIQAIQSIPTPGVFAANWVIEHNLRRSFDSTFAIPTGVTPITISSAVDNPTWGVTLAASGPTGYVQVQGGSGTVQFGGWITRTVTSY